MIYALLSKIVASRIYAILWAKSLRMPGLGGGGGVNLIQAMPEFWEHLFLAPLPYSSSSISNFSNSAVCKPATIASTELCELVLLTIEFLNSLVGRL